MTQVLRLSATTKRRSLAANVPLSDDEIKERWRKHIGEITKDLSPPQSEDLTYEQGQWLRRTMRSPMPKPYKPLRSRFRTGG